MAQSSLSLCNVYKEIYLKSYTYMRAKLTILGVEILFTITMSLKQNLQFISKSQYCELQIFAFKEDVFFQRNSSHGRLINYPCNSTPVFKWHKASQSEQSLSLGKHDCHCCVLGGVNAVDLLLSIMSSNNNSDKKE